VRHRDRRRIGEKTLCRVDSAHDSHPFWPTHGGLVQNKCAYKAEHGGVHGDSQRQRQHGDGSEPWPFAELAQPESQILKKVSHAHLTRHRKDVALLATIDKFPETPATLAPKAIWSRESVAERGRAGQ